MDTRTYIQEMRYVQALGYSWGRKDDSDSSTPEGRKALVLSSSDFATFFAVYEDKVRHHKTIQDAFDYFADLRLEEQAAYGRQWLTLPYNARVERLKSAKEEAQ